MNIPHDGPNPQESLLFVHLLFAAVPNLTDTIEDEPQAWEV